MAADDVLGRKLQDAEIIGKEVRSEKKNSKG